MVQAQRVTVNVVMSRWLSVTNEVPQVSIQGPILFYFIINELDTVLKCILNILADITKLGGAIESHGGREALLRVIEKLEGWAIINYMKFNKIKYQILHLGWGNPTYTYRWVEKLENSQMERDMVDGKLNLSQQYVLETKRANCTLWHIRHGTVSVLRERIVLLCSALMQPHLKRGVCFQSLQYKKDVERLESIRRRETKMIEGFRKEDI